MTSSRRHTLRRLMATLFETEEGTIVPSLQIGDVPQWDSLGHAKLMLAIEDEFEVALTADEISELQSVEDIEALLDSKFGPAS